MTAMTAMTAITAIVVITAMPIATAVTASAMSRDLPVLRPSGPASRRHGQFYSEHDEMMPSHFAHNLISARYGSGGAQQLAQTRLMCVPGGHCSFFADVPEIAAQYRKYLHQIGFLN